MDIIERIWFGSSGWGRHQLAAARCRAVAVADDATTHAVLCVCTQWWATGAWRNTASVTSPAFIRPRYWQNIDPYQCYICYLKAAAVHSPLFVHSLCVPPYRQLSCAVVILSVLLRAFNTVKRNTTQTHTKLHILPILYFSSNFSSLYGVVFLLSTNFCIQFYSPGSDS